MNGFFYCFVIMSKHDQIVEKQIQNLANKFRDLRKSKGYSNYEPFAYDHEIGRSQWGRYEKGHDIRFSTLVTILDKCEISLKEFFSQGFEEENE